MCHFAVNSPLFKFNYSLVNDNLDHPCPTWSFSFYNSNKITRFDSSFLFISFVDNKLLFCKIRKVFRLINFEIRVWK